MTHITFNCHFYFKTSTLIVGRCWKTSSAHGTIDLWLKAVVICGRHNEINIIDATNRKFNFVVQMMRSKVDNCSFFERRFWPIQGIWFIKLSEKRENETVTFPVLKSTEFRGRLEKNNDIFLCFETCCHMYLGRKFSMAKTYKIENWVRRNY